MNYVFSIGGGGGGSPPRPFLAFRLFAAARIEKGIFSFIFRFPFFLRNDREENRFIWINFSSFSRRWIEDSKIFQRNIWIVSSLSFKKKIGRVCSILLKKEREKKIFSRPPHSTLHFNFAKISLLRSWNSIFLPEIFDMTRERENSTAENGNFARNVEQLDALWFEFLHFYKCCIYISNVTLAKTNTIIFYTVFF